MAPARGAAPSRAHRTAAGPVASRSALPARSQAAAARQQLPPPSGRAWGLQAEASGSAPRSVVARIGYPGFDNFESDLLQMNTGVWPSAMTVQQGEQAVRQFDFLVIGSGIAGLTYALKVAQYGSVAVITKDAASEGCTRYAQGGVCAVLDRSDSVADHVRDTIVAGAFLNDRQ